MLTVILWLALAVLFGAIATEVLRHPFRACLRPLRGQPKQEFVRSLGAVTISGALVLAFYGLTGGGLAALVTRTPASEAAFRAGAILGASIFAIARLSAMTQHHGAIQSLSFSVTTFLALLLGVWCVHVEEFGGLSVEVARVMDGTRAPGHFGQVILLSLVATVVSEGIAHARDRYFPNSGRATFSLLRQQMEGVEGYPCWQGQTVSMEELRSGLLAKARASAATKTPVSVTWMTYSAPTSVLEAIDQARKAYLGVHPDGAFVVRVLARHASDAPAHVAQYQGITARYDDGDHKYRLLTINNQVAYFGVKLQGRDMAGFPEFMCRIEEPTRLAHLHLILEQCWAWAA